ncbi:MAG: PD40 domain-containing protein, partial [Anaerolineae bacterium]|nr:PD40 domain-containing protein [Anaerolineae bacterium]
MKHITRLFLLLSLVLLAFNNTPAPVSAQLENVIGGYSDISVGFTPLGHAGGGFFASMSGDNRYVAYSNELPLGSIILYDRQTSTHINLFQEAGISPNGNSWQPSLSQDGRYIAFQSDATNLVPNDINGLADIFLYDRQTKVFELISVDSAENQMMPNPNLVGPFEFDKTWFPHISPDGRYVVFESNAPNLVADDTNDVEDIFIRDRQAGTTTRLSVNMSGNQSNGRSLVIPKISANGRYVVFTSDATDLVPNDTNGVDDVFVRDLQTNTTIRVSEGLGGIQTNGASASGDISADGRYIVFQSDATNLIANDTNNKTDVFVKDMQTGTVIRVSVGPLGEEGDQMSLDALISDDGRYVSFASYANNWGLVPPPQYPDMLLKHLYRHD